MQGYFPQNLFKVVITDIITTDTIQITTDYSYYTLTPLSMVEKKMTPDYPYYTLTPSQLLAKQPNYHWLSLLYTDTIITDRNQINTDYPYYTLTPSYLIEIK